jgi:acetylornithine deacetylase
VAALQQAFRQASGTDTAIEAATYGADMRHFVNTGSIPCLMFGAGDVRAAHAPDESLPLDDLFLAVATEALLIADW